MGQTLLTLTSIVLLSMLTMSINKIYITSVRNSVETQHTSDAINFGRDLSDRIHNYAFKYAQLDNDFGGLTDETTAGSRIEFVSPVGETLYATVTLSAEGVNLVEGQTGRIATIRVFHKKDNNYEMKVEYSTSVVNLSSNP